MIDLKKFITEWIVPLVIGIVCAAALKFFVLDVVYVKGASMVPTFEDKNLVFAEKISIRYSELEKGDIVIVEPKHELLGDIKVIKRVIALEGDSVEIKEDGYLYLNDKKIEENYINGKMKNTMDKIELKENEVFIMGDNRNNSTDSRHIGPVTKDKIKSKVLFK